MIHASWSSPYTAQVLIEVHQAIRWCIQMDVDIISMSWVVPAGADSADNLEDLRSAIRIAELKGILMFGASSDDSTAPYPASIEGVIQISACLDNGNIPNVEPMTKKEHFGFPGGTNNTASTLLGDTTLAQKTKPENIYFGSSFATALAAGFAALLMHCVAISSRAGPQRSTWLSPATA